MILSHNSAQPALFTLSFEGSLDGARSVPWAPAAYFFSAMRRLHPGRNCGTFQRSNVQTFNGLALTRSPAHPYKCPLSQALTAHILTNARGVWGARSSALSCRSLHQKCFTTPFQSNISTFFLKTAGVSPNNSHSGTQPGIANLPIGVLPATVSTL